MGYVSYGCEGSYLYYCIGVKPIRLAYNNWIVIKPSRRRNTQQKVSHNECCWVECRSHGPHNYAITKFPEYI